MTSAFRPAWWCRNPHLQTLWPRLARARRVIPLTRERLTLPDGDFLDLDWSPGGSGPVVLILHGLEGSSRSPYARGLLGAVQQQGWRGVVMHFRGCSGAPNRRSRSYHSGETGDLAFVVATLRERMPAVPLAAIGFSLGGNVLLKWLGETGKSAGLDAAVAVSVPFVLARAALRLNRGFSRLYQWKLLRDLRRGLERKSATVRLPIRLDRLAQLRSFYAFDHYVTAPLHGFTGADDYYTRSSSRQYLRGISLPTLILQAADDPFMTPDVIPSPDELSPTTTLEVSAHGGHVGFIAGRWPWAAEYWLEQRIPAFLQSRLGMTK